MEKLSPLSVKCLANMKMILDSLSVSVGAIEPVMSPYYDELEKLLKKEQLISGSDLPNWERGTIYALGYDDDCKNRYLVEIYPALELRYRLPFEQTKKRNPLKFKIDFGYMCDEELNVIYFQLFEETEKIGLLTEDFASELNSSIPNDWKTGLENGSIYVEFTVDENLSEERINECSDIFKTYILLPVLNKLRG